MSKDIILMGDGAALPAHLQQYQSEAAQAASLVTGFASLPKLSIKGKQFRIDKESEEVVYPMGQPIELVILAADPPKGCAKSFYKSSFIEGSDEMPNCFSSDSITPDSFVDAPEARSCAECPHNAFGSGTNAQGEATKGKACSDHKNLLVVEASDLEGPIYNLRVPATSLKGLSVYGRLLAKNGAPFQVIVTELTFSDAVHPQLVFNGVRYLDEAGAKTAVSRSKSDEVQLALPSQNQIAAPKPQAQLAAPSPEPEMPPTPERIPVPTMLPLAKGATYEAFIDNGWTDDNLIKHGYMEIK